MSAPARSSSWAAGGISYTVRVSGLGCSPTRMWGSLSGWSVREGQQRRIVRGRDDFFCLIFKPLPYNTQPVAEAPNNRQIEGWVEKCTFDVRVRDGSFEHLAFMVRGEIVTSMVNVTEFPQYDSNVKGQAHGL